MAALDNDAMFILKPVLTEKETMHQKLLQPGLQPKRITAERRLRGKQFCIVRQSVVVANETRGFDHAA